MAAEPSPVHGGGQGGGGAVLEADQLAKSFQVGHRRVAALAGVSLAIRPGAVTGLIGPDGAGKTTFMRLAAGLLVPDGGRIEVLGLDAPRDSLRVQAALGYMPQRFGLYEDLTVQENLDLYADLQGVPVAERPARYAELMHMTGLEPFTGRLAGRLSGGMKQKLGLACTLVRAPRLLLLDEPTVGVDPVSRRELWAIVDRLVRAEGMSVLLSTAYLDEAERCAEVILLHEGRVLDQGDPVAMSARLAGRTWTVSKPGQRPRQVQAELAGLPGVVDALVQGEHVRVVTEAAEPPVGLGGLEVRATPPRFEDCFVDLLRRRDAHLDRHSRAGGNPVEMGWTPACAGVTEGAVIEVRNLERRFGEFKAVAGIDFSIRRGEIFGLLGANGAGKTTTFRMLCGLLPASAGHLEVAGLDLRHAAAAARGRIGYMSQKFSLYGNLSVAQNLDFFARVYGLAGAALRERLDWALAEFDLAGHAEQLSGDLPLGYKQRLAMACALMHRPEIIFLDEPTSGVDPLARREFWQRINGLARQGVTVLVTTHFMEEAEYCDRLAIMAAGRILALAEPAAIKAMARSPEHPEPSMEDAFIRLVEDIDGPGQLDSADVAPSSPALPPAGEGSYSPLPPGPARRPTEGADMNKRGGGTMRLKGLIRKEFLQIVRDPSSIAIAFLMPIFLLMLFGYGVSLDAEHVPIALVAESPSADSADFMAALHGSASFAPRAMTTLAEAEHALLKGEVRGIVRLRADFARRLRQADGAPVQVIVNGVDANTARLVQGYVEGAWGGWLAGRAARQGQEFKVPVALQTRIWFNSELKSRNYLVPGLVAIIMTLIGALLTAMVMAREWERGTMEALLVTPASMTEVLLGKLIAYFTLGTGGMLLTVGLAVWQFEVPLRGSFWVLWACSSLFLLAALGMGLTISTLARSQFVAGQIALIATFLPAFLLSGFLFDIGSMPAVVQAITHVVVARYFVAIVQTLFLAGDVWAVILPNALALAAMAAIFLAITWRKSRKRLD